MRKAIVFILVAMFVLGALALVGCKKKEETPTAATPAPTVAPTPVPTPAPTVAPTGGTAKTAAPTAAPETK